MKKFRDKRKFNDVVTTIARAQKDVDNVLKAAGLERNDTHPRQRFSIGEDFVSIIMYLVTFIFVFGLMWLATK